MEFITMYAAAFFLKSRGIFQLSHSFVNVSNSFTRASYFFPCFELLRCLQQVLTSIQTNNTFLNFSDKIFI